MNAKQVAKQYPELHAWFFKQQHPWAVKMMANLRNYDSLTDNQISASIRIKADAENLSPNKPSAPVAELDLAAIEFAFNNAKAKGVRQPKMSLAHFQFKAASPTGANPGAIYIQQKNDDKTYLGKVLGGKMTLSRDCSPELVDEVRAVVADPKQAAIAYGKEYGICCICNRTLTDPDSIANGIGPICADNFGW
jgi:hypothetical protein